MKLKYDPLFITSIWSDADVWLGSTNVETGGTIEARGKLAAELVLRFNAHDPMLAALEAIEKLFAPESGFYIGTVGPTSREARERIDRTFQQVADALHAAKGEQ